LSEGNLSVGSQCLSEGNLSVGNVQFIAYIA
jgi:hypothetical protein